MPELNDQDLSFLLSEDAKKFVYKIQTTPKSKIQRADKLEPNLEQFKKVLDSDEVLDGFKDILRNLLCFNPYFRWSPIECLASPIFDDIRSEELE